MRKLLALGSLVLLVACGGKSNSGPSSIPTPTPAPTAVPTMLTVKDGVSGQPVSGAPVVVGSKVYTTDGGGQVTVPLKKGDALTIQANGFLPRLTMFRDPSMTLWSTSATSPDYINALVYNEFVPGRLLSRPAPGVIQIVLSDDIKSDDRAMDVVQQAMQEIIDATEGRMTLRLAEASIKFSLTIDAEQTTQGAGVTYNNFSNNVISGSKIYVNNIDYARSNTVLHELGHALGLGHSSGQDDIMNPNRSNRHRISFSDNERRLIKMMMLRLPGTAAPDNDQAVTNSSFGQSTAKIVD